MQRDVLMQRPFNFSAGPAAMPEEVLAQAADEMLNWPDASGKRCGIGVMEMSHRGKEFSAIYAQAEADFRALLAVPAGSWGVVWSPGRRRAARRAISRVLNRR